VATTFCGLPWKELPRYPADCTQKGKVREDRLPLTTAMHFRKGGVTYFADVDGSHVLCGTRGLAYRQSKRSSGRRVSCRQA
jgi:hypothetical protein